MITASHNPPSDNGFKCYGPTGGQVIPPDDQGIIECVKAASDREIPEKPFFQQGLGRGLDRSGGPRGGRGLHRGRGRRVGQPCPRPLHRLHPAARSRRDLRGRALSRPRASSEVNILASQRTPDGDFPNVPEHVANPENPRDTRGGHRRGQGHRRRSRARQRPGRRPHRRGDSRHRRSQRRLDHPRRQPDRRPPGGVRHEGNRDPGTAAVGSLPGHDAGLHPDGQGARRARGNPHRGRPARRLQVDRRADRSRPGPRASSSGSRNLTAT